MSVIRLIHVRVDPGEEARAEEIWKTECAPLMIQQKGCLSEKLTCELEWPASAAPGPAPAGAAAPSGRH